MINDALHSVSEPEVMRSVLREVELDKVKLNNKRLHLEFNTYIPPDITPNTRILAFLGIHPKETARKDGFCRTYLLFTISFAG